MRNESDAAASLAMTDFRLFDRGTATVVDLDTGTDVIATLAGFDPAWSNDDVVAVEPGESAEALLLYLLPPGASDDLALLVGQTSIDLGPSLSLGEAVPAAEPELLEATVVAVRDGSRLTVDVAGQQETVQYLGLQAPTGDACFAAEATTANTALVEERKFGWSGKQPIALLTARSCGMSGSSMRMGIVRSLQRACSRLARRRPLRRPTPDIRPGCRPRPLSPHQRRRLVGSVRGCLRQYASRARRCSAPRLPQRRLG